MGRKKLTDEKKALRKRMVLLRDSGLLPNGYGQMIVDNLKEKGIEITLNKVYQVSNGRNTDADIIDELIHLASENKIKEQLKHLDEMLKVEPFGTF